MILKLIDAIKADDRLDLEGHSPELIAETIGFETINSDFLDDLQYYVTKACDELYALEAEWKREIKTYTETEIETE